MVTMYNNVTKHKLNYNVSLFSDICKYCHRFLCPCLSVYKHIYVKKKKYCLWQVKGHFIIFPRKGLNQIYYLNHMCILWVEYKLGFLDCCFGVLFIEFNHSLDHVLCYHMAWILQTSSSHGAKQN